MRLLSPLLLASFLFALLAPQSICAESDLSFDSRKKSVTAKANDSKITVSYHFENTSQKTITIARWDSACSCLSARIKAGKMAYLPGEKGEIHVDFALGSFSGTQEKTIMLWSTEDASETPSIILSVAITIPVLFEISPKSLAWDLNGDKKKKHFKIKVHHDQPINILSNSGTNETFPYTVKTIREGWEYEITVSPTNVSLPSLGMIKITTDSKIRRYQRQQAFVYVRTKKNVKE